MITKSDQKTPNPPFIYGWLGPLHLRTNAPAASCAERLIATQHNYGGDTNHPLDAPLSVELVEVKHNIYLFSAWYPRFRSGRGIPVMAQGRIITDMHTDQTTVVGHVRVGTLYYLLAIFTTLCYAMLITLMQSWVASVALVWVVLGLWWTLLARRRLLILRLGSALGAE